MMVIYLAVKFEFVWTKRLRVRVRKQILTDRQTDKKWTNSRNYTNFERNLAMMVIYLPVKFEFDWTSVFELESGNKNVDGHRTHQSNGLVGYMQPA